MLETTQAIGGTIPGAGGSQIERTTGAIIDHEQFLTLLVTQMQNQDPLEPMSNQEFAAQMAQFGQLERLNSIDGNLVASLEAQVLSTQAVTNTMAASLIGKEVLAAGNSVVLDGSSAKLYVSLSEPAEKMTIDIYNDDGKVVWSIQTGAKSAGPQTIAWDGTNNAGDPLPEGIYTYKVSAKDINGQVVELLTATSGIITGVSYESGVATLMVGDLFFPMGDVISISMPGS